MDQFLPRRIEKRPYNLVTAAAALAVKGVIRPFMNTENFVLTIKIPDREDIDFYKSAVHDVLDPYHMMDDDGRRALFVDDATDISASGWELVRKFAKISRAILFHVEEDELTTQLALTVDKSLVLTPPGRFQFRAAGRAVGLHVTDEEATYLASQALCDIQLPLRPGRSVSDAIFILRSRPKEEPEVQRSVLEPGAIDLHELHGYGAAKDWGLQKNRGLLHVQCITGTRHVIGSKKLRSDYFSLTVNA